MSFFQICLNYLSYLSNLLKITYYLNNKISLLEPSPIQRYCMCKYDFRNFVSGVTFLTNKMETNPFSLALSKSSSIYDTGNRGVHRAVFFYRALSCRKKCKFENLCPALLCPVLQDIGSHTHLLY